MESLIANCKQTLSKIKPICVVGSYCPWRSDVRKWCPTLHQRLTQVLVFIYLPILF